MPTATETSRYTEAAVESRRDRNTTRDALGHDPDDVDVDRRRDQLADTARRYRRHRSQETDLVDEAVNVDLGFGD